MRRVAEEVAALRYVLRNVLRLAMETEGTEDYIRLAETYGMGCVRLRRLARLEEELRRGMAAARREEALDEVEEEMGRR